MTRTLLASLASIGLFSACSSTTSPSETSSTSPAGSWSLVAFDLVSGQSVPVPDPSRYTLVLGTDLVAHLRADCNVCNGNYTSSDSSLRFGLFACTRAACLPGSLETPYLDALGSTSSYALGSGELRLRYEGGVLRFGPI